jgi:hypothetical protein
MIALFLDLFRPARFARYCPAPRLGTRRIERRLLRRVSWNLTEPS